MRSGAYLLAYTAALGWVWYSWSKDFGDGIWFSRSGAVLVFTVFCIQNHILILRNRTSNATPLESIVISDEPNSSFLKTGPENKKNDTFLQVINLIIGATGTLIWAYGDSIFRKFQNVI